MSFDDEDFIPDSGALFNFGEIGSDDLVSKVWIKNDPIKEICCGDDFIVLITDYGRVFSYGKNDWGQLGIGHCNASMNPISIKSLKNSNDKAVHVACGRCHTIISTEGNKLFGFGSNSEGQLGLDNSIRSVSEPTEITGWNCMPIKQLSAGGEFSAALTANGDIYVWGCNSEGQLGISDTDVNDLSEPTHLKFFSTPVTSMSCGAYHMGAISANVLYMWGEVNDGKLGLGDNVKTNQNFPQKVLLNSPVKQIACGNNHSTCLTLSGDVYVWGQGDYGQLGLGPSLVFVNKPTQLKLPTKVLNSLGNNGDSMVKFVKIAVGERHSAVVNAAGLIFTFGDGRHGKLGNLGGSSNYSNQMWPTLMEKLSSSLWVEDVDCGGCHTVVLIRHRRIDEQLDTIDQTYLSTTMSRSNESHTIENSTGRARRHRKNDTNKENTDDYSNLPTLKATILSSTTEMTKRRRDSQSEIEGEISAVKSYFLKSAPSERNDMTSSISDDREKTQSPNLEMPDYDMTSSTADDLERIQGEMKKYVTIPDQEYDSGSHRDSLNKKVDNESAYEIVRKRPRKKRKIKPVIVNQDPIDGFDQSVWNNDLHSDMEDNDKHYSASTDTVNNGNQLEQKYVTATPEIAKIGCQPSCNGNQKSGTCTMI